MEEKEFLLTQEGYDNLEKQLEYLKTEKRAEISERIKVALGFGDLSENSEYDEAKNAQAENEIKIVDLEFDEELEYTIVGSTEVDLSKNRISNVSPIGAALIGKKKGQTVEANTPGGIAKYKILEIKK